MIEAILVEKDERGYRAQATTVREDQLPEGEVTVRVEYSTLNYKDGLAITGKGPVVRSFPMVPGIDFAGVVETSTDPEFSAGDRVILNGWGVGEQHWGGLAQKARVKGSWLIHQPSSISSREAMAIGTAGYTAMLCVIALERFGLTPKHGPVLVTGANGGVGSFAIAILSGLGYRVVAATGRVSEAAYLEGLGATEIIDREQLSKPGKPLQKEQWAAAIDSVGSHTLANVCAGLRADGAVAACGMAQGLDLPSSVAPFILRGVSLLGINSVTRPREERAEAWRRLAASPGAMGLARATREIALRDVLAATEELMAGKLRGRVVVNVWK
ncbi:MDR family oxidoreductase [Hyphomicrobium sp. CS1BSMeth3]|uniref:acrylyl-CoA reductase (NADPH) n=1 Tax=Hyphomicrobium sp. CS1BSMeth3 TaxID=1892844 RepID=UPI0009302BB6|nr:MDR family oxidoreductase [Hyphomicrobium sp. CS1BSMeth3]